MEEPLLLQRRDDRGVVTLTLNRPQAFNALSEAMLVALGEAVDALADDGMVRAVVLGASGKAFCAGHDLKEMRAEPSLEYYHRLFAQCTAVMLSIQRLPVPVIARVHVSRPLRAAGSSRCATSQWRAMTRASRSVASTSGCSARPRESRCRAMCHVKPPSRCS